jgi:uronate dehydrogenase
MILVLVSTRTWIPSQQADRVERDDRGDAMRVLVTGAAGVVGRAVRRALADEHDLVLLDRRPVPDVVSSVQVDIRDWRVLRQTLEAHKPLDAIIHLVYAPENLTLASEEQTLRQFDVSVRGTWAVLQEAHRNGASRCVYSSSMSVFGSLRHGPYFDDSDPWNSSDIDEYGLAKLLGEDVVHWFALTKRMTGISLRLYGVHEPGVMERRGTHADDVGMAFKLALDAKIDSYEAINLTPDNPLLGISNGKAREILGWRPSHTFESPPRLDHWTLIPDEPPRDALPEPGT